MKQIIAELTPVLHGWGYCFRTGNANREFSKMDYFVVQSLRRGQYRRDGQRPTKRVPFTGNQLYGMCLHKLMGTADPNAPPAAAGRGPATTGPQAGQNVRGMAGANSNPPPEGAPPLFIAVAADDQTVGYQGSIDLFGAWRRAGIPAELHVFQTGQHGFGKKGGGADHYLDRVEEWLKLNG